MTPAFDKVRQLLKQLPGMGHRSAERIALHLLVERPAKLAPVLNAVHATALGAFAEAFVERDALEIERVVQGIIDRVDFNATTHGQRDLDDDRLSALIEAISARSFGPSSRGAAMVSPWTKS